MPTQVDDEGVWDRLHRCPGSAQLDLKSRDAVCGQDGQHPVIGVCTWWRMQFRGEVRNYQRLNSLGMPTHVPTNTANMRYVCGGDKGVPFAACMMPVVVFVKVKVVCESCLCVGVTDTDQHCLALCERSKRLFSVQTDLRTLVVQQPAVHKCLAPLQDGSASSQQVTPC